MIFLLIISELALHLVLRPQYRVIFRNWCSQWHVNTCVRFQIEICLGDAISPFMSASTRVHQKIIAETAGELFRQMPVLAILPISYNEIRWPYLLGGAWDASIIFDVESKDTCEHLNEIQAGINYCKVKIIFSLTPVEIYVEIVDWSIHRNAMTLDPEICPKIIESRARNEINIPAMRINKPIK